MRKYLLFALMAIALVSCQREIDWSVPGSGGGTSGNQLVRTVSVTGNDSVVTTYTYDGNNRLIREKIVGMSGGIDIGTESKYYRNSSGIITSITMISNQFVAVGIDSTVTRVNYNTGTSRYTSKVTEISAFGFSIMDSVALLYDASGKLTGEDDYQAIPLLAQPYELSIKTKYTYAANGNMTEQNLFSYDAATGMETLESTIKYTFDSKTAAMTLNKDAYAISRVSQVSVNNPIKIETVVVSNPAGNNIMALTYTYNNNNRPRTAVNTQTPGGVANMSYFYQ